MHNLFGTDGIRRQVGAPPFTQNGLVRLSSALSTWITTNFGASPSVLIAHDTRQSAYWIKAAIKTGLLHAGISVYDSGTAPTPAAYALIKLHPELSAGIIISASHNPYNDNGIKIVDRRSHKLTSQDEHYISQLYFQTSEQISTYETFGIDYPSMHLIADYQEYVLSFFVPDFLAGINIVLDCANGATVTTAASIFATLGAQVTLINSTPNGININDHCGAVHPEQLQQSVMQLGADIGFAFDGDGDRVITVTRSGAVKNGDDALALLCEHPRYRNQNAIVGTVMTNYGFEKYLALRQCTLIRANVGDKYVAEHLNMHKLLLGGEQSGHVILNDYLGTGDGVFNALRILETILLTNNWEMETFITYPQITISVPISHKKDLTTPELATIIETYQNQLNAGRLLIRYSGTENVIRIMVEDDDLPNAQRICTTLSLLLHKELN